jgi:hypothetical protein
MVPKSWQALYFAIGRPSMAIHFILRFLPRISLNPSEFPRYGRVIPAKFSGYVPDRFADTKQKFDFCLSIGDKCLYDPISAPFVYQVVSYNPTGALQSIIHMRGNDGGKSKYGDGLKRYVLCA